jgi:hypothetical protein
LRSKQLVNRKQYRMSAAARQGRACWASVEAQPHEETEEIPFNCPFAAQDAYVHVLLRRLSKGRFRGPSDCIGWPPAS